MNKLNSVITAQLFLACFKKEIKICLFSDRHLKLFQSLKKRHVGRTETPYK